MFEATKKYPDGYRIRSWWKLIPYRYFLYAVNSVLGYACFYLGMCAAGASRYVVLIISGSPLKKPVLTGMLISSWSSGIFVTLLASSFFPNVRILFIRTLAIPFVSGLPTPNSPFWQIRLLCYINQFHTIKIHLLGWFYSLIRFLRHLITLLPG